MDPDVCHALGLRSDRCDSFVQSNGSLRDPGGFSNRPYAFDAEAVRSLRGLAEIAVAAHEREIGPPQTSHLAQETSHLALVPPLPIAPEPFAAPPPVRTKARVYEIKSRVRQVFRNRCPSCGATGSRGPQWPSCSSYWWWHGSVGALRPEDWRPARPPTPVLNAAGTSSIPPLQPGTFETRPSGIAVVRSDKSRTTGVMQNAAQIETAEAACNGFPCKQFFTIAACTRNYTIDDAECCERTATRRGSCGSGSLLPICPVSLRGRSLCQLLKQESQDVTQADTDTQSGSGLSSASTVAATRWFRGHGCHDCRERHGSRNQSCQRRPAIGRRRRSGCPRNGAIARYCSTARPCQFKSGSQWCSHFHRRTGLGVSAKVAPHRTSSRT